MFIGPCVSIQHEHSKNTTVTKPPKVSFEHIAFMVVPFQGIFFSNMAKSTILNKLKEYLTLMSTTEILLYFQSTLALNAIEHGHHSRYSNGSE